MRKLVIYAIGQLFERYKEQIDWDTVVAIVDKKLSDVKEINHVPVLTPQALVELEYDSIAIFSNKYFESIKRELIGEYSVLPEKIVSWKEALRAEEKVKYGFALLLKEYFRDYPSKKVLDVGMNVLPYTILSAEELNPISKARLDGVKGHAFVENNSLYCKTYNNIRKVNKHYDAIVLSDMSAVEDVEILKEKTDVLIAHFALLEDGTAFFEKVFDKTKWCLQQMPTVEGVLWIAKRTHDNFNIDAAIYVVTHKEYAVKADELYQPICVGTYAKEGYLSENVGENISYLNHKINECTALYWIWKNTSSEYVGLNHYRRDFYNSSIKSTGNYLDKETIKNVLENYDIILPTTQQMGMSMREIDRLRTTMDENAFEKGYELVRNAIKTKQPDYVQAFDDVMNGHNIFVCNMFVTKREVLNAYCQWLFSFLIEVAEDMDVSGYDDYSKRVIGFFAERMWTVWLRKQKLKIKEMPYDEL